MHYQSNKICKLCNTKVYKCSNKSNGFMEAYNNNLFHFDCVSKYGYHKFCKEVIEYNKDNNTLTDEDINNRLNTACDLMDLINKLKNK